MPVVRWVTRRIMSVALFMVQSLKLPLKSWWIPRRRRLLRARKLFMIVRYRTPFGFRDIGFIADAAVTRGFPVIGKCRLPGAAAMSQPTGNVAVGVTFTSTATGIEAFGNVFNVAKNKVKQLPDDCPQWVVRI